MSDDLPVLRRADTPGSGQRVSGPRLLRQHALPGPEFRRGMGTRRRTLASLSHGLLEALAIRRLASAGTSPDTSPPLPLSCTPGRVGRLPLAHRPRGPIAGDRLSTFRTNQLQPRLLPSHPQLPLLAVLVHLYPIDFVSRPSENSCPVMFPHSLRLAKDPLWESWPLRQFVEFLRRAPLASPSLVSGAGTCERRRHARAGLSTCRRTADDPASFSCRGRCVKPRLPSRPATPRA